ncbi:MAG: PilN domain-containing protein [Rhodocyclales bacterium]|nr:PilN domain-containing protein [Rhodocyclales bacterium]
MTMANLHLDFIHPRRPAAPTGWLALAAGLLVLAAVLTWHAGFVEPDVAAAELEVARMRKELAAREPAAMKLDDGQLAAEWQKALTINQRLGAPWQKLLAMLESYVDEPVALLSIDPDLTKKDLVLTGEARNLAALLDYVRFLKRQGMLSDVTLQSHQVNKQDRDRPVRFRISATWEHER